MENIEKVQNKEKYSLKKEIIEWLESIVFSVAIVILLFTFVFRLVGVDGSSMVPTLHHEDRLVITNLFYDPKPGDIVIIAQTEGYTKPLVKRVIATEGQEVDINFREGIVYVDGQPQDEPYTSGPTRSKFDVDFPVTVPEGKLFVLGDNRGNSTDSRSSKVGMVDEKVILGKAILRILPFEDFGIVK